MSAAAGFGENVIVFAVEVQLLFAFGEFDGGVRSGLPILRVKVQASFGQAWDQLIIDIGVETATG